MGSWELYLYLSCRSQPRTSRHEQRTPVISKGKLKQQEEGKELAAESQHRRRATMLVTTCACACIARNIALMRKAPASPLGLHSSNPQLILPPFSCRKTPSPTIAATSTWAARAVTLKEQAHCGYSDHVEIRALQTSKTSWLRSVSDSLASQSTGQKSG